MKHKFGLLLLLICVAISTGLGLSTESLAQSGQKEAVEPASTTDNGQHQGKEGIEEDDDEDEHEGRAKDKNKAEKAKNKSSKKSKSSWRGQQASVVPVNNATYSRECAACHFAYLPGLLPAASWKQLMASLDDHYGEDASLDDPQTIAEISRFLARFSADNSDARRSRQIMASLKDSKRAPTSISEIPYIRHKHREIPQRMIKGNKQVRSLSNCIACHDKADRGVFTEHGLKIPGYGYWDD
jgi:hypothetical protein